MKISPVTANASILYKELAAFTHVIVLSKEFATCNGTPGRGWGCQDMDKNKKEGGEGQGKSWFSAEVDYLLTSHSSKFSK